MLRVSKSEYLLLNVTDISEIPLKFIKFQRDFGVLRHFFYFDRIRWHSTRKLVKLHNRLAPKIGINQYSCFCLFQQLEAELTKKKHEKLAKKGIVVKSKEEKRQLKRQKEKDRKSKKKQRRGGSSKDEDDYKAIGEVAKPCKKLDR